MDRIELIKAEIERLKGKLIYGACASQLTMETNCKEEAYNEILFFIDSLQEEPSIPDIVDEHFDEMLGEEPVSKETLKTMLDDSLAKETKDSWNKFLDEPVSEDLQKASKEWLTPQLDKSYTNYGEGKMMELTHFDGYAMLDAIEFGANWQKKHLWKPSDGDDLPEIEERVIALVQDYHDDKDHLRIAFAHRPNKYTKIWNFFLGEEQVIEIERHGKGGWNIPNVKYWLDIELPKKIEL